MLEMYRNVVFSLVNMEMELLNRHYRFRKMEIEVFVKTPVMDTVAYNFIKRN